MSIVSVTEFFKGRRGDLSWDGKTTQSSVNRVFHVETDDPIDDVPDILRASGIPSLYDSHPRDQSLWVTNIAPDTYEEDRMHWLVNVIYSHRPGLSSFISPDRPWTLPPKIRFGSQQYQIPMKKAYNAIDVRNNPTLPVQNSAHEDFDPPVVEQYSTTLITIERNECDGQVYLDQMTDFQDTINSFYIQVAGVKIQQYEGRMRKINLSEAFNSQGIKYWEVTYEIEIDRRTWLCKPMDMGFNELKGSPLKLWPIKANMINVTEAQRLNGAGLELNPKTAPPIFFDGIGGNPDPYHILWEADWKTLHLPATPVSH